MNFVKTTGPNLQKGITVIDRNNGVCTRRRYDSILDMPKEEMIMYIANAFAETPDMSDMWARSCIESMAMLNRTKNMNAR